MEKKLYYVYLLNNDLIEYFKKKCGENNVEIVSEESALSKNGELLIYYVIKAEEGIISPKWELK